MSNAGLQVDFMSCWGVENIFCLTHVFETNYAISLRRPPHRSAPGSSSKASKLDFLVLKHLKIGRAAGGREPDSSPLGGGHKFQESKGGGMAQTPQ